MTGGVLRLLGPGEVSAGSGYASNPLVSIGGTGTVRRMANVVLNGSSIPYTTIDEASLSTTGAPLGGVVTATLIGSANLFGGIVFGFPQPAVTVPDIAEELWVNPLGFVINAPLGPPLTFWLSVPNDPIFRGMMFGWQGVTLGQAGFVLTNPAWFCVQ